MPSATSAWKKISDTDRVTHGTLSRSHLLCLLKIFLHQDDKWDWPDKYKPLMSSKAGLNFTAVAEIDDELADVLTRGLKMEILSHKIMFEEPDGASKISQALNLGNDIALATAETTAIAAVSETITFAIANSAFTARAARGVAFEAIKSSCKAELRAFTEKEDFVELFEFIVNLGANNADYIPGLVEFLSVWFEFLCVFHRSCGLWSCLCSCNAVR